MLPYPGAAALNLKPGEAQPLRSQVVDWLVRLEAAPQDRRLRAEFDAWIAQSERHRTAYRAVEPIWQSSRDLSPSVAPPGAPIVSIAPRTRRRPSVVAAGMALAACLVLYFFFPAMRMHLEADHVTGVAEHRTLVLEDGSRIALDAGSAIAVDYSDARRKVTLLAGQAFFEVTPMRNRPFAVTAGDLEVTVTGTAFSVATASTGTTVAVQSGAVDVAVGTDRSPVARLARGQRFKLEAGGRIARAEVAPNDVGSWRTRRLIVHEATVRDVVEQLARYRRGMIVFRDKAIAGRLVTGVIDLERPREALQALVELHQGVLTEVTPLFAMIGSR